MKSIRRQMLVWLLLALTLVAAFAALAVYSKTRAEARRLFDYQMQLMASALPSGEFMSPAGPLANAAGDTDMLVVQIWDENGNSIYLSNPGFVPPQSVDIGFSTVSTASGSWRVYNTVVGNGVVQVSQPTAVRERLAAAMALRTILPVLLLLPILAAIIWVTVGHGLKPLKGAAAAISRRSAQSLDPLPDKGLPVEVAPLVQSINELLARLQRSFAQQRSFIADAAHGLRTPLTALRLQAQLAERADVETERQAAFTQLRAGLDRLTRLVEQLLALARSESAVAEQPFSQIDLVDLARNVTASYAPMAGARRQELGLAAAGPLGISGDEEEIRTLLDNLVDNALRYSPRGGTVEIEVGIADRQPFVSVADNGPGVPEEEWRRVFDRFYRHDSSGATGSGLGLAIVQQIAQRHGARVHLEKGIGGRGLKVSVRFGAQTFESMPATQ